MASVIKYKKSVVSFLDILGFGSLVSKLNESQISKILDIAVENSKTDGETIRITGRRGTHFSDTIVMSCPLQCPLDGKNNRHGLMWDELMSVIFLQAEMIDQCKTLLRGAITMGDIHHEDDKIFGPAVIRGYELESKLSVFPRVIIDPALLEAYKTDSALWHCTNNFDTDYRNVKQLIKQDSDGLWFVDYLNGIHDEFDQPNGRFTFWEKHRDLIQNTISKKKLSDSVLTKYSWLAMYHNSHIAEHFDSNYGGAPNAKDHYLVKTEGTRSIVSFP